MTCVACVFVINLEFKVRSSKYTWMFGYYNSLAMMQRLRDFWVICFVLKSNGCWFWIWNNLESGRNSSGWMRILIGSHTFIKTDSRVPKKTFRTCRMNAVVPNFIFVPKSCWLTRTCLTNGNGDPRLFRKAWEDFHILCRSHHIFFLEEWEWIWVWISM